MAMIDVDLVLSSSIAEFLRSEANVEELRLLTANHAIMVLPAFELSRRANPNIIFKLREAHKAALLPYYRDMSVVRFRWPGVTHMPTNYQRWFTTSEYYSAYYKMPYEPWYIAQKMLLPLYDERFLG